MAYTYHGTSNLVMAPGRSVQTFPSGLVRVERSYTCRKADAARYRADLAVGNVLPGDDGTPALDGVYIFPEPMELAREDGFTEFRVTAYGRSNVFADNAISRSSVLSTYVRSIWNGTRGTGASAVDTAGAFVNSESPSLNETFTLTGVLPSNESATSLLTPPNISNPLVIPIAQDGSAYKPLKPGVIDYPSRSSFWYRDTTIIYLTLETFASKPFGAWSEYTVVWKAQGTVVTF
jgi:hypothetical protein